MVIIVDARHVVCFLNVYFNHTIGRKKLVTLIAYTPFLCVMVSVALQGGNSNLERN